MPGTSRGLTIATFIVNCIMFYCIFYFLILILLIIIASENLPWGSGNKVCMYVNRSANVNACFTLIHSHKATFGVALKSLCC